MIQVISSSDTILNRLRRKNSEISFRIKIIRENFDNLADYTVIPGIGVVRTNVDLNSITGRIRIT
ncbi:hypothetical protein SAMN04488694_10857 [Natrinema hispanicum]|uniref:Uncharacterized protein n=1 Tax=Natrinema hispanicum TaxID=392421 RepID=A0A1I0FA40_9EURY|nr:hypothetical protein SAMN04488694_10857 [Natrinema hispanicum]